MERVEVKDVRLPVSLQRAMAAEAEASREAKAKIIAAQGEMNAAKNLKEAADTIASSSGKKNCSILTPFGNFFNALF